MNGDAYFDRMEVVANMQEALNRGYAKGYADAKAKYDRPNGKWVEGSIGYHYCSECHNYALADDDDEEVLSDFCPCCGAKMIKEGCEENG